MQTYIFDLLLEGNVFMKQFNVVFGGAVSGGHKVEDVKKNLAELFKADPQKIDQLFEAPRVVLKRNVDYDQAMKYQSALQRAGAVCDVQEVIQDMDQQAAAPAAPPPLQPQSGVHMVGGEVQGVHEPATPVQTEKKSGSGVGDIIAGVVLIGIGFLFGGSVFLGNPGLLDYLFDGLGLFWIGKGIYRLVR
ncbi:MAG: hypothetical protein JRE72_16195 [Deltaproteobacteria bacterium]|jgi:hypothetical protein|nr:hypothetical protein [Deltaproteobacteria bacterium]